MNRRFEQNDRERLTDDLLTPVRHIREALPFVLARYMADSGQVRAPDRTIRQLTFFDDAWGTRTGVQAVNSFLLSSTTRK